MAVRVSTGFRDVLAGKVAKRTADATNISYDAATKQIRDGSNALMTDGFRPGDIIKITGSADNNGTFTVVSLSENGSYMVVAESLVDEAAGVGTSTITASGKSLKEIFANSVLRMYSGSAPASANDAETGTLLMEFSVDALAFTRGLPDNALNFPDIADGVLSKPEGDPKWQAEHLASGNVGYFRLYDNARVLGAVATAVRIQGTVATSGGDLTIKSSASVEAGGVTTITTMGIRIPAS
jgi:hypothetical protein